MHFRSYISAAGIAFVALFAVVMSRFALLVGLFTLVFSAGCGGASSNNSNGNGGPVLSTVSGTVAVGTAPSAIAVDPTSNKIYVADFGTQPILGPLPCSATGADVTVIDGATESATAAPLLSSSVLQLNPIGIALNPARHAIYVVTRKFTPGFSGRGCSHFLDGVDSIDTSTLRGTGFIYQGPAGFSGIDVNQVTGNIYLALNTLAVHNSIVVIGGNGAGATIPVGSNPIGVAVDAATNKIYVASSGSNNIAVIDGATNSVSTLADPGGTAPDAVAVNPATNTIYVANHDGNGVTVIDGFTGSLTATVSVGTSPVAVAVDAQRNMIYVANAGSSQTGNTGSVTIINGATNATTTLTDPKAKNPVAVAVNSVTNKIYVANSGSNNVTVIDGAH